MKKKIIYLLLIMVACLPLGIQASNLYQADSELTLDEVYDGTSFFAGTKVTYTGTGNGVNFIAGQELDIAGTNDYTVLAGESVTYTGTTIKDGAIVGNQVTISEATFNRDVVIAGTKVDITDSIARNAIIASNQVTLTNVTFTGDLKLSANVITIGENVVIDGTVSYNSSASVTGLTNLKATDIKTYNDSKTTEFKDTLLNTAINTLEMLLVGLVICYIAPKLLTSLKATKTGSKIGYGLLSLVLIPMIGLILLTTTIGIELATIIFLLYALMIILSYIIASYIFGQLLMSKVFKAKSNLYLDMVIGIVSFKLLTLIPYLGSFVSLAALLYGLGTLSCLVKEKKK